MFNYYKGVVYKTTNGGNNWGYQVPQIEPVINIYTDIHFFDKSYGWAYNQFSLIHTNKGGYDTTIYTGITNQHNIILDNFEIKQNYPNPFNPGTNIEFVLQKAGNIILKIFDINGKEIQTLLEKKLSTGNYSVKFNAGGISTGIYFYRLEYTDFKNITYSKTKAMIYLK